MLFIVTCGHLLRLEVNVICDDLSLFTLICHCFNHSAKIFKWLCISSAASIGSSLDDNTAVSSANVAISVLLEEKYAATLRNRQRS